jgi:hypothetical protein
MFSFVVKNGSKMFSRVALNLMIASAWGWQARYSVTPSMYGSWSLYREARRTNLSIIP